jgi:hypothetical protein
MFTKDGIDGGDWRDNIASISAAIAQFRFD